MKTRAEILQDHQEIMFILNHEMGDDGIATLFVQEVNKAANGKENRLTPLLIGIIDGFIIKNKDSRRAA